jgi:hypothetical protein
LGAQPALLPYFFRAYGADRLDNYRRAHEELRRRGVAKRYFGDKFVGIDSGYSADFKDVRVIFCARNLPEWIGKDSVRKWHNLDENIVPFAVQYTKHFVESFLLQDIFYIKMEDFLSENAKVVHGVWQFLGMEPPRNAERWWETIGKYEPDDPKGAMNWWRGHASSAVAPQDNDTRFQIRRNAFWDDILPVFDKYYGSAGNRRFERPEIEQDLVALQAMMGKHVQSFSSCFAEAVSQSHNPRFKNKRRRKKSPLQRVLGAIGIR